MLTVVRDELSQHLLLLMGPLLSLKRSHTNFWKEVEGRCRLQVFPREELKDDCPIVYHIDCKRDLGIVNIR